MFKIIENATGKFYIKEVDENDVLIARHDEQLFDTEADAQTFADSLEATPVEKKEDEEVKDTAAGQEGGAVDGGAAAGAPVEPVKKEFKVILEAGISTEDGAVHAAGDIVDLDPEDQFTVAWLASGDIEAVVPPVQYKVLKAFGTHAEGDILTVGDGFNMDAGDIDVLSQDGTLELVAA